MDTELHEEQVGQEMFDPLDLLGGGAIPLGDWLKFYSEHTATETAITNPFDTLEHAAIEQFKNFQLKRSKENYRGDEWLTMKNGKFVIQLAPGLRNDIRLEPVRKMAVRQPLVHGNPVDKAPAVVHV